MASPFEEGPVIRDALVGLSCIFAWYLASLVTAKRVAIGPAVGMLVLTAVCAVVAYRHGKQLGNVDMP